MRRLHILAIAIIAGSLLAASVLSCNQGQSGVEQEDNAVLDSLLSNAISSMQTDSFEVALSKLQNVRLMAESEDNSKFIVWSTLNIGNLYLYYNGHEEGLNYYLKALHLAEKLETNELLNTIYNNIGIVYSTNRNYEKAEEYFTAALVLSREREETRKIAINLINFGSVLEKKGELERATEIYEEAATLFAQELDTVNLATTLNNIGNVHIDKQDYTQAGEKYHRALSLLEGQPEKHHVPAIQFNLGKVYTETAQYDSALYYLKISLDSLVVMRNTDKVIEANTLLARVYDLLGDEGRAIDYYTTSLAWNDTLLTEKSKKWVSEIQMQYEFGKQEQEIHFLNERARLNRRISVVVISALLVFSFLLFYTIRIKNINLKQRNLILKKEQEMASLELSRNKAIQEKLRQELDLKNRELASKAMHLFTKSEVLDSLLPMLDKVKTEPGSENEKQIKDTKRFIEQNINLDGQWEDFKVHFEEVHAGFFTHILNDFQSLTQTDLRLSAYLLINLSNKEIAQISGISPESVRKRKQRLKEKLSIGPEQELRQWLARYDVV